MNLPLGKTRIAIVYPHLPQYRTAFFCGLRDVLASENISLDLYYGKPPSDPKGDERNLDWAAPVRNHVLTVMGRELVWQPVPRSVLDADLVILLQNTLVISNFALAARFRAMRKKVAFWGHGVNYQSVAASFGNKAKKIYTRRADWFFAYTNSVAAHLMQMGFPQDRITVVQNAIDTRRLVHQFEAVDADRVEKLRRELGLAPGPVGLYCGGMYDLKRLPFLIEAGRRLRQRIPSFQMVFLGSGTDAARVKDFAKTASWVRYVGPKFCEERVPYFKLADVLLMPGLVGLAILDSFALQTPMVTTRFPHHSPEIDYLEPDRNGLITEDTLDSFVDGTVRLLQSPDLAATLKHGCREGAQRYTLQAMVSNFHNGISNALRLSHS
ncbi:MAG: glycosyltransferase family 4 protein [Acidobacteriaceae bacterium]